MHGTSLHGWASILRGDSTLKCDPRSKDNYKHKEFLNWHGLTFAHKMCDKALAVGYGMEVCEPGFGFKILMRVLQVNPRIIRKRQQGSTISVCVGDTFTLMPVIWRKKDEHWFDSQPSTKGGRLKGCEEKLPAPRKLTAVGLLRVQQVQDMIGTTC